MSGLDALLNASVDAVRKSGMLEANAMMGTVSAVNTDGTVDVDRAGDLYASVRVLSGYMQPAVGDRVELLRSAGGWVCIGKLMQSSAPVIQSGTFTQAGAGGQWTNNMTVNFPKPFATAPVVVAMPNAGGSATTSGVMSWQCTSVTTTSFLFRHWRDNTSTATFGWIAVTL